MVSEETRGSLAVPRGRAFLMERNWRSAKRNGEEAAAERHASEMGECFSKKQERAVGQKKEKGWLLAIGQRKALP